jgi:chromosome segregation ATPase
MKFLWYSVLILILARGRAGDVFLGSNGGPEVSPFQFEQGNEQQPEGDTNSKTNLDKGSDTAADEGSPLELTTEDGLAVSTTKPPEPTLNGNMDGAMLLLHQRLESEEQFNQRLQQLLAKSALDTRNKQGQVVVLKEQLAVAMQSQQNANEAFMKKIDAENAELAAERSHTKALEKQLRNAGHMIDSEHSTISLLRGRMGTILSHLKNVTHIGKIMESELADSKAKEGVKSRQLAAVQHQAALQQRVPMEFEEKLHEVQASQAIEGQRLKAAEHENLLLRQRVASTSKRDKIFENENAILRKQLRGKAREEQKEATELERVKEALAEAQKKNLQLQDKYADSLKSLLIARGDGVPDASALASDSSPSADGSEPVRDGSLLMQLTHDSKRLRSVMSSKASSRAGVGTVKIRASREDALSHDSQGLTALLNRMSNSTDKKALK